MKIYAVRDRLIDYFLTPFAAPGDKQVMAAIAQTINNQGANNDDIKAAPHQFEIWSLGTVLEDGHIEPEQVLICNCKQLVRGGVREIPGPESAAGEAPTAENGERSSATLLARHSTAYKPPDADKAPPEGRTTEEISAGH